METEYPRPHRSNCWREDSRTTQPDSTAQGLSTKFPLSLGRRGCGWWRRHPSWVNTSDTKEVWIGGGRRWGSPTLLKSRPQRGSKFLSGSACVSCSECTLRGRCKELGRPRRRARQKGGGRDVKKRGGSSSFLRRACCHETGSLVPVAGVKVIH